MKHLELHTKDCNTDCSYFEFDGGVYKTSSKFYITKPRSFARDVISMFREEPEDGLLAIVNETCTGDISLIVCDISGKYEGRNYDLGRTDKSCDVIDSVLKKIKDYNESIGDVVGSKVLITNVDAACCEKKAEKRGLLFPFEYSNGIIRTTNIYY